MGLCVWDKYVIEIVRLVGILLVGVFGGGYLMDIDELVDCYVGFYWVVRDFYDV